MRNIQSEQFHGLPFHTEVQILFGQSCMMIWILPEQLGSSLQCSSIQEPTRPGTQQWNIVGCGRIIVPRLELLKFCELWPDCCSRTWTFKRLLSPVVFGYTLVLKRLTLLCRSVLLNQYLSGTFRTGRPRETVSLTHLMARCSGCFGGTSGDH